MSTEIYQPPQKNHFKTSKIFQLILLCILFFAGNTAFAQCTTSSVQSICNNNGEMTLDWPSAGPGPYTYEVISSPATYTNPGATLWAGTTYTWQGVNPGAYTLQITDANGANCSATVTVAGNYVDPVDFTTTSTAVTGCVGDSNGTITAILADGLAPYSYEILSGPSSVGEVNNTGVFTGLAAGNYVVRGYDNCGNFVTQNVAITDFSFAVSGGAVSTISCTSFSFDALTVTPTPPGVVYSVKQGTNVLATGTSLPLVFTSTSTAVGSGAITLCASDVCGFEVCTPTTNPTNEWNFTDLSYTATCAGGIVINSLTTTGTITPPYTTVVSYSAPGGLVNETISSNATPYTLQGVTTTTNPLIYSVTITDACGTIKTVTKDLTFTASASASFASCSTGAFTASAGGFYQTPVTYSISPDPNAAGSQTTGEFTNLADGTYTFTLTDACGKTATTTGTLDHEWTIYAGAYTNCKVDSLATYISIPNRAIGTLTYTQYDGGQPITAASTVIWTDTRTGPNYQSTNPWDAWNNIYIENTAANQVHTFVVTDGCGRSDTVTVTNPSVGHQPTQWTTSVNNKCINKADITAIHTGDAQYESYYYDLWNINTPSTLIVSSGYAGYGYASNVQIQTDLPSGTYVVRYFRYGCTQDQTIDTFTVDTYLPPKIRAGNFFSCNNGTSNIIVTGKSGLTPYQFRIINSVPSGTAYATSFQPANTFTIPSSETLVNVQILDQCGFTATKQIPLKPSTPPVIKSSVTNLNGCNLPLAFNLYVDSIFFPGATYTWLKTAGTGAGTTVIGTTPSIPLVLPTDVGTYSCQVIIPGTCYDRTANYTIGASALTCTNSLGNVVWLDTDSNGVQDANEVGIAGVTVTLYNAGGAVIASTITDAYGNYLFSNLPDGQYSVGFTAPSNYVFSPSVGAGDNANNTNSDASSTTGQTGLFTLSGGETDLTADAGLYVPQPVIASLGSKVWNDENKDGIQDGGELGIAGITVTLYSASGEPVSTTVTDANGNYEFANLVPGTYSVGFTQPAGYVFTGQNSSGATTNANNSTDYADSDVSTVTGQTASVTLVAGENNPGLDAGIYAQDPQLGSIGSIVWNDVDNDGIQDANEAGVPGITVNLLDASGTVIATTVTDAFGNYIFNNLPAATYGVQFDPTSLPSGFTFSPSNNGTNDGLDSDPNATGLVSGIVLGAGEIDMTIDAGIHNSTLPLGGLGTTVWYDRNNDGVQDPGENGVPGVTVTLYNSTGVVFATTTTDASGNYEFNNLPDGQYSLSFTNLPDGYSPTVQNATSPGLDSDPNSAGFTSLATVTAGAFNPTVDAGISNAVGQNSTASLGDKVWNDINSDGIQDLGELGVGGVTVTLYGADGVTVIQTTTTDALGNYLFTGLAAGDYVVGFSNIPAGFTFSNANQGSDDVLDADADATTGGKTGVISLANGEENLTIDAGIYNAPGLASLGSYVWIDVDQDGIQDATEAGLAGVSVTLYDAAGTAIATTTTNANGQYQFTGLTPGTYDVGFSNFPAGFNLTTANSTGASTNANDGSDYTDSDVDPATGRTGAVILVAGENNPGLDAGVTTARASLGNFVWNDLNGNGIQDAGEPGVAGITVILYDENGLPVASTVTDANGLYNFSNLIPGEYQVGFSNIPSGSEFTSQNASGSTEGNDSNVDQITGLSPFVTLDAGDNDVTIDAGITTPQTAGLGNYVWIDADQDGIQDATEQGLPGVTVTLYNEAGIAIKQTITDGNGFYTFADLTPGIYSVGFTNIPSLYSAGGTLLTSSFTTQDNPANDGLDSDVSTSGLTGQYTLVAGEYNSTIDAGVRFVNPLAITINKFNVTEGNNCNELIVRADVSDESDVKNIELLRSFNNSDFKVVKVFSPSNSSSIHSYLYNDVNLNNGAYIYKLKINNMDGTTEFSSSADYSVNCQNEIIGLYPNPVVNNLTITIRANEEAAGSIKVMDLLGNVVLLQSIAIQRDSNSYVLNLANLPSGTYNLSLTTAIGVKTYKVSKQ